MPQYRNVSGRLLVLENGVTVGPGATVSLTEKMARRAGRLLQRVDAPTRQLLSEAPVGNLKRALRDGKAIPKRPKPVQPVTDVAAFNPPVQESKETIRKVKAAPVVVEEPVAPPVEEPVVEETTVEPEVSINFEEYDEMNSTAAKAYAKTLDEESLVVLKGYEEDNKNRSSVLKEIGSLLA